MNNNLTIEQLIKLVEESDAEYPYFKIEYDHKGKHPYYLVDENGRAGDFDTLREALIAILLRREKHETDKDKTKEF